MGDPFADVKHLVLAAGYNHFKQRQNVLKINMSPTEAIKEMEVTAGPSRNEKFDK